MPEATKVLVMEFLDSDNGTRSIVVKDPKDDITLEEGNAVAEAIVENDVFRTATGASYASVQNLYYKEVTYTPLTAENAE